MCFKRKRRTEEERLSCRYSPPIILRGRMGREILETIRNTPKPDDTKLRVEVEELEKKIIEAKENGTF